LSLLKRFRNTFVIVVIPLIFLGFAGGVIVSGRSLKPIQDLNRAIHTVITTGKLHERIPSRGSADELDSLVVQFNHMLERIEILVQSMRDTLDNVAHDIRTPMARLRAKAETALESTGNPEELQQALRDQIEESQRVLRLLTTLMDISEVETGSINLQMRRENLTALLEDMIDLFRYGAEEKDLEVTSEIQAELYADIDVDRIRQVMANLLDNAVKYSPKGGCIDVSASRTIDEGDGTEYNRIRVQDAGAGIEDSEKEKIWDRLYRSDASRSEPGLGLGLSLVKAIVESHGGTISLESQPGQGSCFEVRLPNSNMTKM
jgi:signal transduction histidine kinase